MEKASHLNQQCFTSKPIRMRILENMSYVYNTLTYASSSQLIMYNSLSKSKSGLSHATKSKSGLSHVYLYTCP